MNHRRNSVRCPRANPAGRSVRRAGLAPLELVLALPLLLCVMALIVNFAHAAIWRVRSATNARLAMWRHRPLWNADSDPRPANYWPRTASMGVYGQSRIWQVDPIWNQSAIAQGWIKGPAFTVPGGYLAIRDNRVNEMSEGVSKGIADVAIGYPFLPGMGSIRMHGENSLLDNVWQFHTMGYGWNEARRAKGWWKLEAGPEWEAARRVFIRADQRITSNPQRELLRPFDRDLELMAFYGQHGADYYPPLGFCDNDPNRVRRTQIEQPGGHLDRISGSTPNRTQGVCEQMADAFLQMYLTELNYLQSLNNPPAARIAQLQLWIQQLSDFIAKLQ